jgi:hypothetical protein
MFPIEMKHIGKIDAVGTVQVFGYSAVPNSLGNAGGISTATSARRIDRNLCNLTYLNFAGPPTATDAV